MQPISGNQRPHLLTSLMNMSLVPRLPRKIHLCRSSSNVPSLPSFLEMLQSPHVLLTFDKVENPLRLPTLHIKSGANMWCFDVLCTFWLRNVLRATRACNFSSLIWSHGSAPAALASLLFHPPEPQIIGKTQCFAAFLCFPTFSRTWIFFSSEFLFLDLLSSSLIFSDSSHLCFSICPYCRKFDF